MEEKNKRLGEIIAIAQQRKLEPQEEGERAKLQREVRKLTKKIRELERRKESAHIYMEALAEEEEY